MSVPDTQNISQGENLVKARKKPGPPRGSHTGPRLPRGPKLARRARPAPAPLPPRPKPGPLAASPRARPFLPFPRQGDVARGGKTIRLGGKTYSRIPYGQERDFAESVEINADNADACGDCGAKPGQLHSSPMTCDIEECPRCHGQYLACRSCGGMCWGEWLATEQGGRP